MLLPFIIFMTIFIASPSWGMMTPQEFETFIEPKCFRLNENNLPFINGQENPLASTLENFIALAEKFEAANNKDLKEELFFFIRNFTYNNIEYNSLGDIVRWLPKDSNYGQIDTFWEPSEGERSKIPNVEDPFTDAEKCSLYFMLSHSIVRHSRKIGVQRSPVNIENSTKTNFENRYKLRSDFQYSDEDLYPMEQGVVSIQGSDEAVDLGRVLTGIYVGLNEGRKREMSEFTNIPKDKIPTLGTTLDPLYTLTIAEVIAMAGWRPEAGQRQLLVDNGKWKSVPIGSELETSLICPMIYKHVATESAFSFSSMRGAADGLIIGKIIADIKSKRQDVKLSQILRQYYSRGGFAGKTSDHGYIHASFCNREYLISSWEETIKEQVHLFVLLASTSFGKIDDILSFSWGKYEEAQKKGVFRNLDTETRDYCGATVSENKLDDFVAETPLDLIVVLDSGASEEDFKRQQMIIGSLAKRMQLSYSGSRMTIFVNQKVSPSVSTPGIIYLKTIVDQTYSPACAACAVTQIAKDPTAKSSKEEMIIALNQYLNARNENETQKSGVNGQVLILFDFDEELPPPGRETADDVRLKNALSDFLLRHRDVSVFPVGKNYDVLKKYSRGVTTFALMAVALGEDKDVKDLYNKITAAPARLQYTDCEQARSERSAVYEDYVSQSGIQHWSMPAKYMYKSFSGKFMFESFNGPAKVCFSRDTKYPEREITTCHDLANGSPLSIPFKDPCKGFNDVNCSPFYFSIVGLNDTTTRTTRQFCDDKLTENKCKTMDQIKFKISHEGVRCSGSMGLLATPVILLAVFLISHFFSRNV